MTLSDALTALSSPLIFGDSQQIEAQKLLNNWPRLLEAFTQADAPTRRQALNQLYLTTTQFNILRSIHISIISTDLRQEPPR
jgi:hypothetical protein